MTSVFIGGSRRLGRMNGELSRRLDNIVRNRLRVLVGDANGFDRAAQVYLAEKQYGLVVVYCTAGKCRNNVGGWTVHAVDFHGRDRGREFYTAKDDAMLRDAEYGFFAWDGKSQGTLRNIRKMADQGKPSAVYVSTIKRFATIRSLDDAADLFNDAVTRLSTSEQLFADDSPGRAEFAEGTLRK